MPLRKTTTKSKSFTQKKRNQEAMKKASAAPPAPPAPAPAPAPATIQTQEPAPGPAPGPAPATIQTQEPEPTPTAEPEAEPAVDFGSIKDVVMPVEFTSEFANFDPSMRDINLDKYYNFGFNEYLYFISQGISFNESNKIFTKNLSFLLNDITEENIRQLQLQLQLLDGDIEHILKYIKDRPSLPPALIDISFPSGKKYNSDIRLCDILDSFSPLLYDENEQIILLYKKNLGEDEQKIRLVYENIMINLFLKDHSNAKNFADGCDQLIYFKGTEPVPVPKKYMYILVLKCIIKANTESARSLAERAAAEDSSLENPQGQPPEPLEDPGISEAERENADAALKKTLDLLQDRSQEQLQDKSEAAKALALALKAEEEAAEEANVLALKAEEKAAAVKAKALALREEERKLIEDKQISSSKKTGVEEVDMMFKEAMQETNKAAAKAVENRKASENTASENTEAERKKVLELEYKKQLRIKLEAEAERTAAEAEEARERANKALKVASEKRKLIEERKAREVLALENRAPPPLLENRKPFLAIENRGGGRTKKRKVSRKNKRTNRKTNKRTNRKTNKRTNRKTNKRTNRKVYKRSNKRTNRKVYKRSNKRTNRKINRRRTFRKA